MINKKDKKELILALKKIKKHSDLLALNDNKILNLLYKYNIYDDFFSEYGCMLYTEVDVYIDKVEELFNIKKNKKGEK